MRRWATGGGTENGLGQAVRALAFCSPCYKKPSGFFPSSHAYLGFVDLTATSDVPEALTVTVL